MSVQFRPLGDRVLIKPDQAPQMTESGLHLAEHWKPEQTGTVLAVGQAKHPRADEVERVLHSLAFYIEQGVPGSATMTEAADLLQALVSVEPSVQPGEYVVFSWAAGHEIWTNDGQDNMSRVLLLREQDVLAVVGSGVTVETCEPNREVSA